MKEETTISLIEKIEDIKKNGINCQATSLGFELICAELNRRGILIDREKYFKYKTFLYHIANLINKRATIF